MATFKNQQTAPQNSQTNTPQVYEVNIAGVPLRLKSSNDEATVRELINLVDRKVREALPLTKTGSLQTASIFASLHLAEELLMLKRKTQAELQSLESKAEKILSDLEDSRTTPTGRRPELTQ